jgi:hypothetical protein
MTWLPSFPKPRSHRMWTAAPAPPAPPPPCAIAGDVQATRAATMMASFDAKLFSLSLSGTISIDVDGFFITDRRTNASHEREPALQASLVKSWSPCWPLAASSTRPWPYFPRGRPSHAPSWRGSVRSPCDGGPVALLEHARRQLRRCMQKRQLAQRSQWRCAGAVFIKLEDPPVPGCCHQNVRGVLWSIKVQRASCWGPGGLCRRNSSTSVNDIFPPDCMLGRCITARRPDVGSRRRDHASPLLLA